MISAGNDGDNGAFYTSGAADGINVTSVGSVDNTESVEFVVSGQYSDGYGAPKSFDWSPGIPQNFSDGLFPVYAPNFNTSILEYVKPVFSQSF
jgi:hypothetical protein